MIIVEIFKMLGFIIAGMLAVAALISLLLVLFLIGAAIFDVFLSPGNHQDQP